MQQLPLNFKQPFEFNNAINVNKMLLKAIPYSSPEVQKVISNTYIGQTLHEDTLGKLFEKLIDEVERKNLGQFYTPKEIVNYMLKFLDIKYDSKILDPTCGCGIFLTTVYNYLRRINKNAIENIYGVDLNKTATELARINLWVRDGMRAESLKILEKNIKVGNSIVENEYLDPKAFKWNKEFDHILKTGGFDFILGNPPYLTLKSKIDYDVNDTSFSKILNGQVNAASLIVMKSLHLLKNGGVMAFVLPKTLLRVNSYSKLRKFILNNFKILHIVDLENYFPNVRGEQILLFIKKLSAKKNINGNSVLIKILSKKNGLIHQQKKIHIKQSLLKKYNNFLLFENQQLYPLINRISKIGQPLEQLAEIFRGLTLSPSSNLIQHEPNKKVEPIIKGNNITKLDFAKQYFINSATLGPKINRLKREKIIMQNIFSSESGMICAFDPKGYLTFDTVTNIVIKTNNITFKYLLGLLNSKLINFYLIYALFNKSKLTMHTDGIYLGKLPIVITKPKKQKIIKKLVEMFERTKDKKILRELDKQIYSIYKIGENEQKIIDDALRSIMSQKTFW